MCQKRAMIWFVDMLIVFFLWRVDEIMNWSHFSICCSESLLQDILNLSSTISWGFQGVLPKFACSFHHSTHRAILSPQRPQWFQQTAALLDVTGESPTEDSTGFPAPAALSTEVPLWTGQIRVIWSFFV